jgi:lipopolysaccharide transport system ATP-binding protein
MKPAIRVENLSKLYHIGTRPRGAYRTLQEALTEAATAPWRWLRQRLRHGAARHDSRNGQVEANTIWALKDVSFEVPPGEVVGIMGRNGAGKSTLLKILSRITEPTSGRVRFSGRVGSLLEVGTGFHQELTGRENVYLNGAILGMKRREIAHKFDEIVAFAEIEKFIDTPVKRYSSGMYVRLGFAVAAHLEPTILLVDEVLSVGDAAFQLKCAQKIKQLTRQGITTLFISHDIHTVGILARRCLYLKAGAIVQDGATGSVIERYLREVLDGPSLNARTDLPGDGSRAGPSVTHALLSVRGTNPQGQAELNQGDDLHITLTYKSAAPPLHVHFNILIATEQGTVVTCADSRLSQPGGFAAADPGRVTCTFPSLPLLTGRYFIRVLMVDPETDWPLDSVGWQEGRACSFVVKAKEARMVTGMVWFPDQSDYGIVRLPFEWVGESTQAHG